MSEPGPVEVSVYSREAERKVRTVFTDRARDLEMVVDVDPREARQLARLLVEAADRVDASFRDTLQ